MASFARTLLQGYLEAKYSMQHTSSDLNHHRRAIIDKTNRLDQFTNTYVKNYRYLDIVIILPRTRCTIRPILEFGVPSTVMCRWRLTTRCLQTSAKLAD